MKYIKVFSVLFLVSCSAHSDVSDCDFELMDKNINKLITQAKPFVDCKQATDLTGDIVGYKILKDLFSFTIAPAIIEGTQLDNLKNDLNEVVSLKGFFNSIFIKDQKPVNQYAREQKLIVEKANIHGVSYFQNGVAYYQLDTEVGPYSNAASIIFDNNTEKYWDVSSENQNIILSILLNKE